MLFLPAFLSFLLSASCARSEPATGGSALYPPGLLPLITRANSLLSTGQFGDAVRAYTEAIEQSPTDYLLYYKRATAHYSLGRHPNALQDFDRVLELTSGTFDKALLMKARIHALGGEWAAARAAARGCTDAAARDLLPTLAEGEAAATRAAQAQRAALHTACAEAASEAMKTATHSVQLRQLRAECALAAGDVQQTVVDLVRLTHLTSPSTSLFLRIAQLAYFLLPPSTQAQATLKQCLHFDPDSRPCAAAHRQLKTLDKAFARLAELRDAGDWRGVAQHLAGAGAGPGDAAPDGLAATFDDALAKAAAELALPADIAPQRASPRREEILRALCVAFVRLEQPRKGEAWCDALAVAVGAEDVDVLVGRGAALLAREEWEDAARALEKAWEASGRSRQDVLQRLQKAQRLLKQSRLKDYYKVLGVARDADARTIKKAYRRAAKIAHPDKGGSEARMAAVNEAYEVLSNPELRQRFDNGEDPNDPMAQQGGHPFQQGTHPFASFFQQGHAPRGFPGGPGGFQFHFSHGH